MSNKQLIDWKPILLLALWINSSLVALAANPTCGLTIITHGFQFNGTYLPDWVREMAAAINMRTGAGIPVYRVRYDKQSWITTADDRIQLEDGATTIDITQAGGAIILLDWAAASDETVKYPTQDVADRFYNFLFESQNHNGHNLTELPIHLIGHSRGGSLNSRLAFRLAQKGVLVEQVTSIDPHPVTGANAEDWPATTYINTVFADNYYRTGAAPAGRSVPGAKNNNLSATIGGDGCTEHESAHTYYYGTIALTAKTDGNCRIQSLWYQQTSARDETGYNFSRFTNFQLPRPLSGVNQRLEGGGGSGARELVDSPDQLWPNAGFDQRASLPIRVVVGQTVAIPYYFSDRSSRQTITLFLDEDTNPFNGDRREIGTVAQSSRTDGSIGSTTFAWTPTMADIGTHFIGVRTTNTRTDRTRVRYDYHFKSITVQAAPVARPFITSVTPRTLNALPLSQIQLITIVGSGFTSNSRLTFSDGVNPPMTGRVPASSTSSQLTYNIAVGPNKATWSVKVVNDGVESLPYSFYVVPSGSQLTGLSISGPATVNKNSSGQFTATALFSNGSSQTVAPTWNANSTAVTISSSGILNAGDVTSDTVVPILASYTTGGITKSASVNVTILDVGRGILQTEEVIVNGSLEKDREGWTMSGPVIRTSAPHTGLKNVLMGETANAIDTMYQLVTIPLNATAANLTYWYNITSDDTSSNIRDTLTVTIQNASGSSTLALVDTKSNVNRDPAAGNPNYHQKMAFDLLPYRGQTIRVHFLVVMNASILTSFRIDDVSVSVTVPPPVTLTSLAINGPSSVIEGNTAQYTATAVYSDGSTSPVIPVWGEDSSVVSISGSGLLTVDQIDQDRTVTVSASYTIGGITRTASKAVTVANTGTTFSFLAISGPSSINENGSGQFTATAIFSDGSSQPVFPSWSENSSESTISSSGLLITSAIGNDTTITVSASHSIGGVTQNASQDVLILNVATAPTPASLSISGPSSVDENSTTQFTATASFSDGTSQTVNPIWSEDSAAISISTFGLLSAGEVSADTSVTVSASYTSGGITRSASKVVAVSNKAMVPVAYTLTRNISPSGSGTIASDISPGNDGKYLAGTKVTLTATPTPGSAYTFSSWLGVDSQNGNVAEITMTSDKAVTANFVAQASSIQSPISSDLYTIAFGGSSFGVAGSSDKVATSPDGLNWAAKTTGMGFSHVLESIVYANSLFVAVGSGGGNAVILTSPDASNWTSRSSGGTGGGLHDVTWGNGLFVACGVGERIVTSRDGVNWTAIRTKPNRDFYGIAYGNNRFVAVSSDGYTLTSTDGTDWVLQTDLPGGGGTALLGITFGGNTFVAVGWGKILTSADGIKWIQQGYTGEILTRVVYGNGHFVAVGEKGKFVTSPDASNWTSHSTGKTEYLRDVAFGNNTFIAVGNGGTIVALGASFPSLITSHPKSQTLAQSAPVRFSVEAAGAGSPTYQWRLNEADINGETSNALSRSSVMPADAGRYSVVVTIGTSRQISQDALLTVNPPIQQTSRWIDSSFNTGPGPNGPVWALTTQPDGKIIIGGEFTAFNGSPRSRIARLNSDGTLDTSFNPGSGFDGSVHALAMQSDGRLWAVGGFSNFNGANRSRVVRLNSDGTLDTAFAPQGRIDSALKSLAVRPDGSVIVGGYFDAAGGVPRNSIAAFSRDGSIDNGFNPSIGPQGGAVEMILPLANGLILVGGGFDQWNRTSCSYVVLNNSGSAETIIGPHRGAVSAAAHQPDGKILIGGGFEGIRGALRKRVARLYAGADLDSDFDPRDGPDNGVDAVAGVAGGTVLIGGHFTSVAGQTRGRIAALNSDGSVNTDITFGAGANNSIFEINLGTSGTLLIAGNFTSFDGVPKNYVARLKSLQTSMPNVPPSVSISTPANGATFSALANVDLTASASDSDGSISKVEFYQGTTKLAEVTTAPYTYVWQNIPVGNHTLTARATDNKGATTTSSPISITVSSTATRIIRLSGDLNFGEVQLTKGAQRTLTIHNDGSATLTVSSVTYPAGFTGNWNSGTIGAGASQQVTVVFVPTAEANYGGDIVVNSDKTSGSNTIAASGKGVTGPTPLPFVQRVLPANYAPGVALTVTLRATSPSQTTSYVVEDQPPAGWTVSNVGAGGSFDSSNRKVKFGPFFDAEPRSLTYQVTPPQNETGERSFAGTASRDGVSSAVSGTATLTSAQFHPADNNPADWTISISEISAYGSAWKRGDNWSIGPNPIPIDYVSRAGALWRGGETYRVDTTGASTPPLWWVNVTRAAQSRVVSNRWVPKNSPPNNTAVSSLPITYTPGVPFSVSIAVTAASSVFSYVVEDQPPVGWTISNVGQSGSFDANNRKVKWGPFFDNTARTLTYQVTPPVSASGNVTFAGVASFDGANLAVSGQRATTSETVPPPVPTVTIATTDPTASEPGTDTGTFTITRTGATSSPLTVNYAVGGTATAGVDYALLSGSVTIPAGSLSANITVNPIADALVEGNETVGLTLSHGSGYTVGAASSATVTIADNLFGGKPTISSVPDQKTIWNKDSDIIAFTVDDSQTAQTSLRVTGASDNPSLIDANGIQFAPIDSAQPKTRQIIIRPTPNQYGTANITLTVADSDNLTASTKFQVRVLVPPTISAIGNQSVLKNGVVGPIAFTISDVDSFPGFLTVTADSSNQSVFPNSGLTLSGTGANRSLGITPAPTQEGSSSISVTVTDPDGLSASTIFVATVTSPGLPNLVPYQPAGWPDKLVVSTTLGTRTDAVVIYEDEDIVVDFAGLNASGTLDVTSPFVVQLFVDGAQVHFRTEDRLSASKSFSYDDYPIGKRSAGSHTIRIGIDTAGAVAESDENDNSYTKTITIVPRPTVATPTITPPGGSFTGLAEVKLTCATSGATIRYTLDGSDPTISSPVYAAPLSLTSTATLKARGFATGFKDSAIASATFILEISSRVFTSSGRITVRDNSPANPYPSVINVSGVSARVSGVTVTLKDLTHSYTRDIAALLVGPRGQKVILMRKAGGKSTSTAGVQNVTLTFEDSAANVLPSGAQVTLGSFRPSDHLPSAALPASAPAGPYSTDLSAFKGMDANGTWSLYVADTEAYDEGTIAGGWSLSFSTESVITRTPPTISEISDQAVLKDTPTSRIVFTVADKETDSSALSVTAASSNTALVSDADIFLGGGSVRTITIAPASGQVGVTRITLTVRDADGLSASTDFTLTVRPRLVIRGDFNGDHLPDIIFQDTDGFLAAWFMQGAELIKADYLEPSQVGDENYRIVASADFNNDQREDLVFQNRDGTLAVWFMDGARMSTAALIEPSNPDVSDGGSSRLGIFNGPLWRLAAVADLNGDGQPDFILQHANGTIDVWIMNAFKRVIQAALTPAGTDGSWRVVGAGDFNLDGKSDLVFQHLSGDLAVWYLDNFVARGVSVVPSNPGHPDLRLRSTADRNGDGQPDLLFQHQRDGSLTLWFMDGISRSSAGAVNPKQPGGTWEIVAP